jgi:predicted aspartyl protease
MAKLTGSVDELGRPVVRVRPGAGGDDFLAIVDTGFNGELMMGMEAARQLNVTLSDAMVHVELGTGITQRVRNGSLTVQWMGQELNSRVLVSDTWPLLKGDAPIAMIGTRLLRPHLLLVDFDSSSVEIETTS